MRSPRIVVSALALLVLLAPVADAQRFPGAITRPASRGDQLIFFYDARDGFTTFLNLRSTGASALPVQILLYGPNVDTPFVHSVTIPVGPGSAGEAGVGGTLTVDIGALRANGLPAQAGVAFVTAVDEAGAPIVTRVLTGSFTVANLNTGSAWGSVAAARSAVRVEATAPQGPCPERIEAPERGTVIDGTSILLPPIQPSAADLAVYYDPDSLAPAALGGNQVVFVTFDDTVGVPYGATRGTTEWTVDAIRDTGVPIKTKAVETSGVAVTDLVTLLGSSARGSRGSIIFEAEASPERLTRLVYFTQALGTFGTGYLLPTR
ncbi:MAG: hypothetical protein ABIR79_07530 [Candidatus Binatia bacterium]